VAIETKTTALAIFEDMKKTLEPFPAANFHQLIPTAFQERSELFRPAASVVNVNPDDPRDVYPTPGGGGTLCLHSQALERIGNAMGIDWDSTKYEHEHATEPYICTAFVSGTIVDSLGQRRRLTASAKSDLRDGSITSRVLGRGTDTARQFICERTESRARNRAIKKVGNIPTSFTKDELRKPFVAIRFRLDERDPDVKRALIEQGTRATDQVYGRLPAGPVIDAGRADPADEAHEARVDEEPAIPDEPRTAKKSDAGVLIDSFKKAAAARPDANVLASDEVLGTLAYALRDVWQLPNDKDVMAVARRTVARAVFGVTKLRELTRAQVQVIVDAGKELGGQAQLSEIRDFLATADPDFAKSVGGSKSA
jgi:hypothetical protein